MCSCVSNGVRVDGATERFGQSLPAEVAFVHGEEDRAGEEAVPPHSRCTTAKRLYGLATGYVPSGVWE